MPENRRRFSFMFKDWDRAVDATREILQSEAGLPSVFRLSDPEETDVALKLYGVSDNVFDTILQFSGYRPGSRCLLLGTAEGDADFTRCVEKKVHQIAKAYGAISTTGIVTFAWEHGRFKDPYLREDLQDFGVIIDTLECAVSWENLRKVWRAVREYCHSKPNTVVMSHISHFYPQGANLYFIFIRRMDEIAEYVDFQGGILDRIQQNGASMSHHHGIGKMTAPWFEDAIGSNQLAILKALKNHFDPNNIMNPGGTLALDLPESRKRLQEKSSE